MPTNRKRKRLGDRKEGRRLRSVSPFYRIIPYIMVTKSDASNYFEGAVEVSGMEKWLREKRAEGYSGMGMLHLFIAAYVRVCAMLPRLNRFIGGQRIYARDGIEVIMAIKRALKVDADETSIKVKLLPTDTVFDVYRKMNAAIDTVKADEKVNGTDKAANTLMKVPGVILKFAIWLLRLLDYFDLLPSALIKASPFHGSMVVTDLGSLGIPPIYHHLYDFGNCPLFLAFGSKRREVELDQNGVPIENKYVDYKVVCDERICDGHYYATAFKHLKFFLRNPAQLELPPERVEQDVF